MRNRKRLSDAEREQRRAEDRDRVQQAVQQLLSSEGWQRWVRVRARNGLSRYSLFILGGGVVVGLGSAPGVDDMSSLRGWDAVDATSGGHT